MNGNTIAYDAENRQVQVSEPVSLGGAQATYQYDGAGQRVLRAMNGITTVWVYDALGKMAAQYSSSPAPTELCQTCYVSVDHLGTTRLVTDQRANVIARHDYTPFGQEIPAGYGGRSQQWAVGDRVQQKFTGQIEM